MSDSDRMTRAGNYVLGVMSDDERERAERDLEIDPGFRDAVVEMAGRMHVFDHIPAADKLPGDAWKAIEDRLSAMPQMRAAPAEPDVPERQAPFGRRRSDVRGAAAAAAPARFALPVPGRWALAVAAGLIAAFALGYVAGRTSLDAPRPVQGQLP